MINPLRLMQTWTVELGATGSASPELVWERYVDTSRWVQWGPHLTAVKTASERIATGATGVVWAVGVVPARFVITDVDDAARTWSWDVRVGPVALHLHHDVTAVDGGSRAGLLLTGPAPVVTAYAPLASWALQRLVDPSLHAGSATRVEPRESGGVLPRVAGDSEVREGTSGEPGGPHLP